MQFDIRPYQSAGSIELGMSKDQVIEKLGAEFETLRGKATDPNYPTIYYAGVKLMVFFKPPGVVEALEFFEGSNLFLNGTNLFDYSFPELRKALVEYDEDLEINPPAELTSYKLGIAVYAPEADEDPELPAGAIMIFERDYYSN